MQFKLLPLFLLSLTAIIAAPLPPLRVQIGEVVRAVSSEHSAALTNFEAAEQKLNAFRLEQKTAFGPNYKHFEDPEFKELMLEVRFAQVQLDRAENGLPAITQAEVGKTRAELELDFELLKAFGNSDEDLEAIESIESIYEVANSHSGVKEALIEGAIATYAFHLNRAVTPGEERSITAKLELQLAIVKAKLPLNEPLTEAVLLRQPEVFQADHEFHEAIAAEPIPEFDELEQIAVQSAEQHPGAPAA